MGRKKNEKIRRKDGGDSRQRRLASRPHYAYECKFSFASLRAGIYLSRTRGRIQSWTVRYIRESPFLHVVPDFQFLFLLGHLRAIARRPPLANPTPSTSFLPQISERPRRPCTLPQLSATVISRGYFCPRIAPPPPPPPHTAVYFSINYAAVRERYPNDLTTSYGDS